MNPMFDNETKYEEFRATVKIWLSNIVSLDGTDFSANQETIRQKQKEIEAKKNKIASKESSQAKKQLATIPEEKRGQVSSRIFFDFQFR